MSTLGPVYLIASERSGTNLLRKRLTDAQGHYFGASPAHFLKNLYYREPFYGPLEDDSNFEKLVKDALDLCYVHFSPWDISLTASEVVRDYRDRKRDVIRLSDYLMTRYAQHKGHDSYFCKDNFLYEFALPLSVALPTARFIYLYRDPRDFVLSQMKRPGALKSALKFARLWDYEQIRSIRAAHLLGREGRCFTLSYERLIQDEVTVMREICAFLGIQYSPKPSESKSGDKIVSRVHEWRNVESETLVNNAGKYANELSKRQIELIELSCRQTMLHLGYSRATTRAKPLRRHELLLEHGLSAMASILPRLMLNEPEPVAARRKVLMRLHVNYRNPG